MNPCINPCGIDGCSEKINKSNVSGYCKRHRQALKRQSRQVEGQRCSSASCENILHVRNATGFCRDCNRRGVNTREYQRAHMMMRRYQMTNDDYDNLLLYQNGMCPICQGVLADPLQDGVSKQDAPSVDHDRRCCPGPISCGTCIRGILHGHCNLELGWFETYRERDWSAYDKYLKESR